MTYAYKCINEECENFEKEVEIQKPAKDSDKKEYCKKCGKEMQRIFSLNGFTYKK